MLATEIAKYIVTECSDDVIPPSNSRVQNMLYLVQRDFLRNVGRPAFVEPIMAYPVGPVVPDVYYEFCTNGAMPIMDTYDVTLPDDARKRIDAVLAKAKTMSLAEMLRETKKTGGAWERAYKAGEKNHISCDEIRRFG